VDRTGKETDRTPKVTVSSLKERGITHKEPINTMTVTKPPLPNGSIPQPKKEGILSTKRSPSQIRNKKLKL